MRQQKHGLQLQKSGVMRKENSREKKRKEIRWTVQLQSPIFLIRCGKNPVIYDDPAPLSSYQCPSSIQSLNLAHFDSVLGPKKILWISPANLGKNLSCGQESLLSTLDIQTGISWAFDIEIQRFKRPKFIYVSRTTTLMKDSKWDKFVLNNRIATKLGWKPSRGKILCFHARIQTRIS